MPKPLDKMTKPELVKALKAAHKRIAKLERDKTAINNPAPLAYTELTPDDRAVLYSELSPREQAALDDAKVIFPWEEK